MEQIAKGKMTGFVESSSKRRSMIDPGIVMGYYTEAELPVYEFLANNFAICDAWFSSHPGSTFTNRFCATTGQAPETENFDLGDERIGYFKGLSIFDELSHANVDWAYVEGNIGFIRMFDRYRLDTQNVIFFEDDFDNGITNTFRNRVVSGNLPEVTFIDPRFFDVPPSTDANDDLPPADVCLGQYLVKKVYDMLSEAPTWQKTLFVITYDEHGGFFDHVAPPGTPDADDPSPQPLITEGGADHLGVRVPAFLVSPWVDAGKVITTQLEHTSIIKTILERFLSTEKANRGLSSRSAQANSLFLPGILRPQARDDKPKSPDLPPCAPNVLARGPAADVDFQKAIRFMSLPAASRKRMFK